MALIFCGKKSLFIIEIYETKKSDVSLKVRLVHLPKGFGLNETREVNRTNVFLLKILAILCCGS